MAFLSQILQNARLQRCLSQISSRVPSPLRQSLTLNTMAWLGIPVIGIASVAIALVYRNTWTQAETQLRQHLERHVRDRSQRDSEIFQLAAMNQQILKRDLQERLEQPLDPTNLDRFDRLVLHWKDGTWRNFPPDSPIQAFPTLQQSTIFLGPQVALTPALKHHVMLFSDLTTQYGRAFSSRYTNTWMIGAENLSIDYRPDNAWGLEANALTDVTQEEYGLLATPQNNPARQAKWTNLYFDAPTQRWMVSLITPIDDSKGQHLATIGNDIILNDLIAVTVRDRLPHSHNVIFNENGQLIVHPDHMSAIQASGGKFTMTETGDHQLQRLLKQAKQLSEPVQVFKDPQGEVFWAVTKLQGPNWYWVTVYPMSHLWEEVRQQIMPLVWFGGLGLLLELGLLYGILRRTVRRPLVNLSAATDAIARGDFDIELETSRNDEIGQLARSFNSMAEQLQASFYQLAQQNEQLEDQVQIRTQELEQTIEHLKLAQIQLVQSEKMSSLGQMIAGIAHEINNPIGFVHGNLDYATLYIQQILEHLACYQKYLLTDLPPEIQAHAAAIDLDFIQEDLPKLLHSMNIGTDRIREIVLSLRNFSRLDEAQLQDTDIHEGLDSTLLILNHRIQKAPGTPIELIKTYGDFPSISCYPGLLNQVFMNLISNAIDALEGCPKPQIQITTKHDGDWIEIQIQDNGPGMSPETQAKIFDPFFTTKAIGKGTGLGLSISHQIIVDRHQGRITCQSSSAGTTFSLRLPQVPATVLLT